MDNPNGVKSKSGLEWGLVKQSILGAYEIVHPGTLLAEQTIADTFIYPI